MSTNALLAIAAAAIGSMVPGHARVPAPKVPKPHGIEKILPVDLFWSGSSDVAIPRQNRRSYRSHAREARTRRNRRIYHRGSR